MAPCSTFWVGHQLLADQVDCGSSVKTTSTHRNRAGSPNNGQRPRVGAVLSRGYVISVLSPSRSTDDVNVMSITPRKRPPSSSGTPAEPSSSKKQRFVDVAKALLEIAKEPSDAFTPLKLCLGGINALIKHYEEYADVKDKLNDLVPWLKKSQETLTRVNPDDDPEEIERRSHLARKTLNYGR